MNNRIMIVAFSELGISIESNDGNIIFHKSFDKLEETKSSLRKARDKLERKHHVIKITCEKLMELCLTDDIPNVDRIHIIGEYTKNLLKCDLLPENLKKLLYDVQSK